MPAFSWRGHSNRALRFFVVAAAMGGLMAVLAISHAPSTADTTASKPTFATASAQLGSLRITGAYVPQPPSPSVAAAYFTVANTGAADVLVGASSSAAAVVNLHETVDKGSVGTMVPVNELAIPAGGSVSLTPGGKHLMLMDPSPLKQGEFVELTLTFERAGAISLRVPVVPFGVT